MKFQVSSLYSAAVVLSALFSGTMARINGVLPETAAGTTTAIEEIKVHDTARETLLCQDSTEKFPARTNARMRSCKYIGKKFTTKRCRLPNARKYCQVTCGTCGCSDSLDGFTHTIGRFAGEKRSCEYVHLNPKGRCKDPAAQEKCPLACGGTCTDLNPFVFVTPSISGNYWSNTGGSSFYEQFVGGAYVVQTLRMDPGWLSPPMANVALDSSSTLGLSFTYRRSDYLYGGTDPCPTTDLYIRLRLVTGPNDWHGFVASTELVGPFTTSDQTYSKTFTIADDIVSLAQDGYTYYVDTVIAVPEGDPICTGTYAGRKYDVVTNFAYYESYVKA